MSANLRAFLYLVAWCEGTAVLEGYRTLFGGGFFASFDDHPRKRFRVVDKLERINQKLDQLIGRVAR